MSSLFTQISQEAEKQRAQVSHATPLPSPVTPAPEPSPVAPAPKPVKPTKKNVVPQSGTTVPQTGTTSAHLDLEKLRIIIEEISQMPINSNGLNVRMSQKEAADIEDFVHDTLRREGLKGYDVSVAKLMRYALRYMFRVHPDEFVTALREALQVEETLSI